jgi:hypothetical protein
VKAVRGPEPFTGLPCLPEESILQWNYDAEYDAKYDGNI